MSRWYAKMKTALGKRSWKMNRRLKMVGPNGLEPSTSSVSRFSYSIPPTTSMLAGKLLSTSKQAKHGPITGWNHGLEIPCRCSTLLLGCAQPVALPCPG
jgi:hypothetical protein